MPDRPAFPWPKPPHDARCPCLSGDVYGDCCGPLIEGSVPAPTAVRLMRSRYTAFVVGEADYLLGTWHEATRPAALELDPAVRWMRLEILGTTRGGPFDTEGTVEFMAHYRQGGEGARQHENSAFVKLDGRWVYVAAV
jgi:SEC-C motif-containing protein